MKKSLIYLAAAVICVTSCRKEDTPAAATVKEAADLATQNSYDDLAIAKYMDTHYLDAKGKIMEYTATITADAAHPKLSSLEKTTLPSGVIVIKRNGAQPDPGITIGTTDVIRVMQKASGFTANPDGSGTITAQIPFFSSVESTGTPVVDPQYYFVSAAKATADGKQKSYYEMEGFQEGLKHFKSFDIADSENYNMQGIIIVPSRAAFARDEHYPYYGINWRNMNFVFNFQVYKTTPTNRN